MKITKTIPEKIKEIMIEGVILHPSRRVAQVKLSNSKQRYVSVELQPILDIMSDSQIAIVKGFLKKVIALGLEVKESVLEGELFAKENLEGII